MFTILVIALGISASSWMLGVLVARWLRLSPAEMLLPLEATILSGYVALLALLCAISLFWSPDEVLLLVLGVGLGLMAIWQRKLIAAAFAEHSRGNASWLPVVLWVGVVLSAALKAALPSSNYDTGHYHLQAVRWLLYAPLVPGLGNLSGLFVYNSSTYPLAALTALPHWVGYPLAVSNLAIYSLVVWRCARGLSQGTWPLRLFWAVSLIAFTSNYWQFVPAIHADLPVAALAWLALAEILPPASAGASRDAFTAKFRLLMLWAACGVALKLSAVPLLILPLGWALLNLRLLSWQHWRPLVAYMVGLVFFIGLPYAVRNVVQTGYLLYPTTALDIFSVDWKMPASLVRETAVVAVAYNRNPALGTLEVVAQPFNTWFWPWFVRQQPFPRALLALTALLAVAIVLRLLFRRGDLWRRRELLLGLATCYAAILYILFTAPGPRYLHPYLVFGVGLGSAAVFTLGPTWLNRPDRVLRGLIWGIVGLYAALGLGNAADSFAREGRAFWVVPAPMPKANLHIERLQGQDYNRPVNDIRCWDAPLPCTPQLDPRLERRGERLADGFRIVERVPADPAK